jgi:predicted ATPase
MTDCDQPGDRLDELAGSVADGVVVDWELADSQARTEAEQRGTTALRDVSRMFEFNRRLQRASTAGITGPGIPPPTRDPPPAAVTDEAARFGDLLLLEPLGKGASGEVWRAWDLRLRREVALKFLQPRWGSVGQAGEAAETGAESPLLSEARALARLRHPSVVAVYGIAEHAGRVGMWMELLRGETLADAIERTGPLRQAEVVRIGSALALALDAVHQAGLVHRDVKPANVFLEPGRAVLTDFGLGRPREIEGERERISGTPLFMAPELLAGEPASPRSDIYALGVTLRWALTGRPPFRASTMEELKSEAARGPATTLQSERPQISSALVAAIERAMAPAPEHRFATAAELEQALAGELPSAARHTLPAEPDAFIGREMDLEELTGRLQSGSRLVTLFGGGGMGKTRLAVHYGWKNVGLWPGGIWFCGLTEARSVNGIVSAVAGSLGVPLGKGDPIAQLGHAIAARGRCLVILDNFEQVTEHAGETVERWLDRAREARFLVTSRERLGVKEEELQAVEPLSADSGVELFVERARRQRVDFELHPPEADAVKEVVRLTEGMPLAIELAASRVRILTVGQIVERMRERFRILRRYGTDRHASLKVAIDASWELLQEWEKAAWSQCSVFEGGFTLEAAEHVLDLGAWPEAPWIVDVVQSLVDKNLLRTWMPEAESVGIATEVRFGMYVSLQEYARMKLRGETSNTAAGSGSDAERAAEARHGQWYARYGMEAAAHVREGIEKRRQLERELDNLIGACRRATACGDGAVVAAAYQSAWTVLKSRGPFRTAVDLGREALRASSLGREEYANVVYTLGAAELACGMADEARSHLESVLAIAREMRNQRLEAHALQNLGWADWGQGRLEEASTNIEMELVASRSLGDRRLESAALNILSTIRRDQGRLEDAVKLSEMALDVSRLAGDRGMAGTILGNLGLFCHDLGRTAEARTHYEAALDIHRQVQNRSNEATVVGNLANLHFDQGRLEEAREQYEAALRIVRQLGARPSEGLVLRNLGALHAAESREEEARVCYETALAICRELGNPLEASLIADLGDLHYDQGRLQEARDHYEAALALHREVGDRRYEGVTLTHLARLLHHQGSIEAARDALATGERLLREVGARIELGEFLCVRGECEVGDGNVEAAMATLAEAEAVATQFGAGPHSDLGRALSKLQRLLAG